MSNRKSGSYSIVSHWKGGATMAFGMGGAGVVGGGVGAGIAIIVVIILLLIALGIVF